MPSYIPPPSALESKDAAAIETETNSAGPGGRRRGLRGAGGKKAWRDHDGKWSWERFGFTTKRPRASGDGGSGAEDRAPKFDFARFSLGNLCTPRESSSPLFIV